MSKNVFKKVETEKAKMYAAELDFKKCSGILPVIAQDEDSGAVLMLAYANLEAVQKTQETGYAHYWSRSRDVLWKKGESSGHLQQSVEVLVDCDNDTLLYKVHQSGPACHTGAPNCFFRELKNETIVKSK